MGGDERQQQRMREGDSGEREARKAEARGGPPDIRQEAMASGPLDNQPRDRATAVDKRRREAAVMANERG